MYGNKTQSCCTRSGRTARARAGAGAGAHGDVPDFLAGFGAGASAVAAAGDYPGAATQSRAKLPMARQRLSGHQPQPVLPSSPAPHSQSMSVPMNRCASAAPTSVVCRPKRSLAPGLNPVGVEGAAAATGGVRLTAALAQLYPMIATGTMEAPSMEGTSNERSEAAAAVEGRAGGGGGGGQKPKHSRKRGAGAS